MGEKSPKNVKKAKKQKNAKKAGVATKGPAQKQGEAASPSTAP